MPEEEMEALRALGVGGDPVQSTAQAYEEMFTQTDEIPLMASKVCYRLSDILLMRVTQEAGKRPRAHGEINWHTPWGTKLPIVNDVQIVVGPGGKSAFACIEGIGDIRLIVGTDGDSEWVVLVDASQSPDWAAVISLAPFDVKEAAMAVGVRMWERKGMGVPWMQMQIPPK